MNRVGEILNTISMKHLSYGLIAVALAIGFSAFTTPNAKKDTQYWVYTSPTNQEFQYAIKYEIQTLSSEDAAGCDHIPDRPCVLGTVAAIGSDSMALHNYLQGVGTDQQIVGASARTKSDE